MSQYFRENSVQMIRLDTILYISTYHSIKRQINSARYQIEEGGSHGKKKKENQDCEFVLKNLNFSLLERISNGQKTLMMKDKLR